LGKEVRYSQEESFSKGEKKVTSMGSFHLVEATRKKPGEKGPKIVSQSILGKRRNRRLKD